MFTSERKIQIESLRLEPALPLASFIQAVASAGADIQAFLPVLLESDNPAQARKVPIEKVRGLIKESKRVGPSDVHGVALIMARRFEAAADTVSAPSIFSRGAKLWTDFVGAYDRLIQQQTSLAALELIPPVLPRVEN